jgi:hypothetical protein
MSSDAAMAMKVAIDAGASLDEMQRVLLKSVAPQDLFMAIRNAAAKERAGSGGIRADATSSNHHEASGGEAVCGHTSSPIGIIDHPRAKSDLHTIKNRVATAMALLVRRRQRHNLPSSSYRQRA